MSNVCDCVCRRVSNRILAYCLTWVMGSHALARCNARSQHCALGNCDDMSTGGKSEHPSQNLAAGFFASSQLDDLSRILCNILHGSQRSSSRITLPISKMSDDGQHLSDSLHWHSSSLKGAKLEISCMWYFRFPKAQLLKVKPRLFSLKLSCSARDTKSPKAITTSSSNISSGTWRPSSAGTGIVGEATRYMQRALRISNPQSSGLQRFTPLKVHRRY